MLEKLSFIILILTSVFHPRLFTLSLDGLNVNKTVLEYKYVNKKLREQEFKGLIHRFYVTLLVAYSSYYFRVGLDLKPMMMQRNWL